MLVEDAAFHKFSEMSNIGPWLDKLGKLGGAANKDTLIYSTSSRFAHEFCVLRCLRG